MTGGVERTPPLRDLVIGLCGSVALLGLLPHLSALRPALADRIHVAMSPTAARMVHPTVVSSVLGADTLVTDPLDAVDGIAAHTALAARADAVLLAPATAHTLACLCHGLASTLPQLIALCSPAPLGVVPVLNDDVRAKPAVRRTLDQLRADGVQVCGESAGTGRTLLGRTESGPDPHAVRVLVRSLAVHAVRRRTT